MVDHYRQLVAGVAVQHMQFMGRRWKARMLADLEATPMADPPAAAAHLARLLDRMLLSHGSGEQRVAVLRRVQKKTNPLRAGLLKRIAAESHPLSVSRANLAAVLLDVCRLAAQNACVAVWELAGPSGKVSLFNRFEVVRSLNEALVRLREVLALSYQQYRDPPMGTWQCLHALHGFAMQHGIAARRCRVRGGGRYCAQQRYARVLLLAMADPWGMRRSDLQLVGRACALLASRVRFGAGANSVPVCRAGSDSGPGPATRDAHRPPDTLMLDLSGVLAVLRQCLQQAAPDSDMLVLKGPRRQRMGLPRALLERLIRAWHGHVERAAPRIADSQSVLVWVGLSAIHSGLAGGLDFARFRRALVGRANMPGAAVPQGDSGRVQNTSRPCSVQARVLDRSRGGYCLAWPDGASRRVRVGGIVALAPGGPETCQQDAMPSPDQFVLGVVRWLHGRGDEDTDVGVELLSRKLAPALVRRFDAHGKRSPLELGLLLDSAGQHAELVLARSQHTLPSQVQAIWPAEAGQMDRQAARRLRFGVSHRQDLGAVCHRFSLTRATPDTDSVAPQEPA